MTNLLGHMRRAFEQAKIMWASPTYWLILLAVAILCAFIGPFGTSTSFSMAFGLIYWGLSVFICAPIGTLFIGHLLARGWQGVLWALGMSLVFGLIISGIVLTLSEILLGALGQHPGHLNLIFYSFPSAAFILFFMMLIMNQNGVFQRGVGPAMTQAISSRPRLLDRIPELAHATEIWALSAQDHYVRVLTDKGAALALIRLSYAIAECDGIAGVQTHRSHWVALNAIQNAKTLKKDGFVALSTGETLPVSKSRMAAVKAVMNQ